MKRIVPKHHLAIRWFHWVNFPMLTIMIWSGLLIYWAHDVYHISIGKTTVFKFFPKGLYQSLGIPHHLAEGMAYHFLFMWAFILNGILYVAYTLVSGEWRHLWPERKSFREAWQVVLYDLHLRKEQPSFDKYNAAQRIAYTAIIFMGMGSVITGFAIYKPVQLNWLCAFCGGYEAARLEHFILVIGYCLFFLVHIFQVIKTGWNNFRGMVAGFEVVNDPDPLPTTTTETYEQSA